MSGFYVKRNEKLYGAFSKDKLAQCLGRGFFKDEDLISSDSINWDTIENFRVSQQMHSVIQQTIPESSVAEYSTNANVNVNLAPTPFVSAPAEKFFYDIELQNKLVSSQKIMKGLFLTMAILWGCEHVLAVILGVSVAGGDLQYHTAGMIGIVFIILAVAFNILTIIAYIFSLIGFYRAWCTIPACEAKTTPGKAVGFMFIPFFNLYWIFFAFINLSDHINDQVRKIGFSNIISTGSVIALLCVMFGMPLLLCWLPIVNWIALSVSVFCFWKLFYLSVSKALQAYKVCNNVDN